MPSMSSMARTMACPAWIGRAAIADLTPLPEKSWTRDGTAAHDALAEDEDIEEIDSDDVALAVGICREKEGMLLAQSGFEEYTTHIEERMFLKDDEGNPVASGQPDRVHIEGKRFAIVDFKTGRKDAPSPARNPQLIGYAALVAQRFGLTDGVLFIVPAWRQTPPPAEISAEDIATWRTAMLSAIAESNAPHARAAAGEWCDYCPVRAVCTEAWALVKKASQLPPISMQDSSADILDNYTLAKHAQKTIEVFLETVKARLGADPSSIPGLRIGKGSEMSIIPGSQEAWRVLTSLYAPSIILAATKWTPAALAKALTGGKGAKAAQKVLEDELAGIITKKAKSGALELE